MTYCEDILKLALNRTEHLTKWTVSACTIVIPGLSSTAEYPETQLDPRNLLRFTAERSRMKDDTCGNFDVGRHSLNIGI